MHCKLILGVLVTLVPGLLAAAPTPVRVAALEAIALYPVNSAPATVVSGSAAELSAEVAARVVEFAPAVGDIVAVGAVIARLDCRDYELALAVARADLAELEARLELAERRLARAHELSARQSLAAEVLDERSAERAVAAAQLTAARARIARDEVAVSRCVIVSPFRALVRERLAPRGQYVARGTPLVRVIDVDDVELVADVGSDDVATIVAHDALEFVVDARRYAVRLRVAVAAVTTATRTRELRLAFTAGPPPLSGSAGELVWRDARPHVPGTVLVRRGEVLGLFVVTAGSARFVALPEAQAGRPAAVALPATATVIVEGQYGLEDGDAVRLLDD
ncbi:MAG: efflux RND transporter periplasmic adaptor subunit [Gammaproteobacteria bacterium]